jgi:hypothetical protein
VFGVSLQSLTSTIRSAQPLGITCFILTIQSVLDDPMSEEKQGQHIVEASVAAGVECFLWSTLPSSREISGGKFVTRLYEGIAKRHIYAHIKLTTSL